MLRMFTLNRIQCLSDLAQLQGQNSGQLAHLASEKSQASVVRPSSNKRDSRPKMQQQQQAGEDQTTEKLLLEKDEEIRRMQAMIQQMQSQLMLNQSASGPTSLDDSTTV